MKNLYYITRTYPTKIELDGSCGLMRAGAVAFLGEKFNVIVITTNYNNKEVMEDINIVRIPTLENELKFGWWLEKFGIFEDYLDIWARRCIHYLIDHIHENDILFATCGGELASIKIGGILKEKKGCKFVINFRDPVQHSLIGGERMGNGFHVDRERSIRRYVKKADLIITSSNTYKNILETRYHFLNGKVINNYFGYFEDAYKSNTIKTYTYTNNIVYGGSMTDLQRPEIMFEYLQGIDGLCFTFIGDWESRKEVEKLGNIENVQLINKLSHHKYINYMSQFATVGFVSLYGEKVKACIPSKIYEYINLEIPILAALPEGDAMDLINKGGYGIACRYDDKESLKSAAEQLMDKDLRAKIKNNIHNDKEKWNMEVKIREIFPYLESL